MKKLTRHQVLNKVAKFVDKWDGYPDNQTSRWILCDSLEERKIMDKEGLDAILPTDCACCFAGDKSEEVDEEWGGACECPCHERMQKLVDFVYQMMSEYTIDKE